MSMAHPSGRATRASTKPYGLGRSAGIPCADEIDPVEYLVAKIMSDLIELENHHVPQEEITAMQRRLDRLKKETVQ